MAWYSVLPPHLTVYETWIIRTFVILAIINLAPWLSLIVYDILLYLFRTVYHELPVYGGRARGQVRPRAPSLADHHRRMSFAEMITGASPRRPSSTDADQLRHRAQYAARYEEHAIEEEPEVSLK